MRNITKNQTKRLLRKVQRCQFSDNGRHKIGIQLYEGDEGCKIWFTCVGELDGKHYWAECYDWRTYEENLEVINKFIEIFSNN